MNSKMANSEPKAACVVLTRAYSVIGWVEQPFQVERKTRPAREIQGKRDARGAPHVPAPNLAIIGSLGNHDGYGRKNIT